MSDTVSNVLFAALLTIVALRLLWQIHAESKAASGVPAPATGGPSD
jgi:hypothetical protein